MTALTDLPNVAKKGNWKKKIALTPEQVEHVRANYLVYSATKMAGSLGIPHSRIYKYMVDNGLERLESAYVPDEEYERKKEAALALRGQFLPREIAPLVGLHVNQVNNLFYARKKEYVAEGFFNVDARPEGWLI